MEKGYLFHFSHVNSTPGGTCFSISQAGHDPASLYRGGELDSGSSPPAYRDSRNDK